MVSMKSVFVFVTLAALWVSVFILALSVENLREVVWLHYAFIQELHNTQ